MGIAMKSLADGQLASTKGTLYTCPASTETIIKTMTLVNTDTSARDVNLYVKPSGSSSRRIIPKDCELGISYMLVYDDELCLEVGDLIEGDATAATVVDYVISGVEKT